MRMLSLRVAKTGSPVYVEMDAIIQVGEYSSGTPSPQDDAPGAYIIRTDGGSLDVMETPAEIFEIIRELVLHGQS